MSYEGRRNNSYFSGNEASPMDEQEIKKQHIFFTTEYATPELKVELAGIEENSLKVNGKESEVSQTDENSKKTETSETSAKKDKKQKKNTEMSINGISVLILWFNVLSNKKFICFATDCYDNAILIVNSYTSNAFSCCLTR